MDTGEFWVKGKKPKKLQKEKKHPEKRMSQNEGESGTRETGK